jgi:hypothetical protein
MAITSDFSTHPSQLLANALRNTGSKGSFFGRIDSSSANNVYRDWKRISRKIFSI